MDEYADANKAVFSHMKADGVLITNPESDEYVQKFAFEAADDGKEIRTFSAHDDGCDGLNASLDEKSGDIYVNDKVLMNKSDIVIPGLHNVENYMAAILATYDFVDSDAVIKTAKTFPGVGHRLELVCEKDDIRYYNSSIDSSPSRTVAALSCFGSEYDGRVNIILGGYDKNIPFDELAEPILTRKIKAFITGATADKIMDAITSSKFYKESDAWLIRCENFEQAVRKASAAALPGDIVLMSPACASFDEFDNFEKKLIEEVVGKYTAYITDNFNKVRVDARWGMGDIINDISAVKKCVKDRICKPHLVVFSVARKEYDQECKRIKEERAKAVKEITVSLELGGTRAELEEMLAKVGA
jgi:UDP-N-acetylmuramoylalanine--D-glutamate ligase